ncbi:hypothetical protein [Bradyrhizobium sp. B120]|uniref:hypothetical protein n=1 Tax=Bradyrhizobium sp. B120 TaxID=3410088 RepID=UPI003B981E12
MTYLFDPTYWNGTIFHLDETKERMSKGWMEFEGKNQPIPASFFPKSLTFDAASAALPDTFHTTRDIIVFSKRARVVFEEWAPDQVEFIPVICQASPAIAATLKFDSAYYFINVLGRAQRLQWLEIPTRTLPPQEDGTEVVTLLPGLRNWRLRERAASEPLIWRDTAWIVGNKRYSAHSNVFIADALWRELDANFPDQLNAQRVGE